MSVRWLSDIVRFEIEVGVYLNIRVSRSLVWGNIVDVSAGRLTHGRALQYRTRWLFAVT